MKLDIRARFNVLKLMHSKVYFIGNDIINNDDIGIHTRSGDAPLFPKNCQIQIWILIF